MVRGKLLELLKSKNTIEVITNKGDFFYFKGTKEKLWRVNDIYTGVELYSDNEFVDILIQRSKVGHFKIVDII